MKLVIYRNKKTNKITNFHEVIIHCTEEAVKTYNENPIVDDFVEIVDLDENSLAYYFYTLKTRSIKDEAESLRDLEDQIRQIANEIDDRLYDFDRRFKEEQDNKRKRRKEC